MPPTATVPYGPIMMVPSGPTGTVPVILWLGCKSGEVTDQVRVSPGPILRLLAAAPFHAGWPAGWSDAAARFFGESVALRLFGLQGEDLHPTPAAEKTSKNPTPGMSLPSCQNLMGCSS